MEPPALDSLESAVATFYQEVILGPEHDNNELFDMTRNNAGLSGALLLNILTYMRDVAGEVESPGSGDLPNEISTIIHNMTNQEKRKKMASFLIAVEGLLEGRELGHQLEPCSRLRAEIQNICHRFLLRD